VATNTKRTTRSLRRNALDPAVFEWLITGTRLPSLNPFFGNECNFQEHVTQLLDRHRVLLESEARRRGLSECYAITYLKLREANKNWHRDYLRSRRK
jgi:hypothetical protein